MLAVAEIQNLEITEVTANEPIITHEINDPESAIVHALQGIINAGLRHEIARQKESAKGLVKTFTYTAETVQGLPVFTYTYQVTRINPKTGANETGNKTAKFLLTPKLNAIPVMSKKKADNCKEYKQLDQTAIYSMIKGDLLSLVQRMGIDAATLANAHELFNEFVKPYAKELTDLRDYYRSNGNDPRNEKQPKPVQHKEEEESAPLFD